MNHTCLPKEVLLPDWAHRDKQSTKGDRVWLCSNVLTVHFAPEFKWHMHCMTVFLKRTENAWQCLYCASSPPSLRLHPCTNRDQINWCSQYLQLLVHLRRPDSDWLSASHAVSVQPPVPAPSYSVCRTPAQGLSTCSHTVPQLGLQDSSCIKKPSQTVFRGVWQLNQQQQVLKKHEFMF